MLDKRKARQDCTRIVVRLVVIFVLGLLASWIFFTVENIRRTEGTMSQNLAVVSAPRYDLITIDQWEILEKMAEKFARSGLFGVKNADQALALMMVAISEGQHPATVAQEYDIIKGKAARKTTSILERFQRAGGRVEWHKLSDEGADATFTHPQGGSVRIDWDKARAARTMVYEDGKKTALAERPMYKDGYPRAMYRSRCIAEGVRAVWPAAIGGAIVDAEAFDPTEPPKEIEVTGERIVEQPKAKGASNVEESPKATSAAQGEEASKAAPPGPAVAGALTPGMLATVRARILSANEAVGLTEERVCEKFEVKRLEDLLAKDVNNVLAFITNPG